LSGVNGVEGKTNGGGVKNEMIMELKWSWSGVVEMVVEVEE
jgi:hypothetical protein